MTRRIDPDADAMLRAVEQFPRDPGRYLSPWEIDFVESMRDEPRAHLSDSQRMKCHEIRERLEARS